VCIELKRCNEDGKKLTVFSVTDTGLGIRPEDQARLFQAFEQVNSGAMGRQEGTGLGLHLSQKLAELLGGQISFTSEFAKGSVFTLTLRDK
jgi:signal transduction histidine kinase